MLKKNSWISQYVKNIKKNLRFCIIILKNNIKIAIISNINSNINTEVDAVPLRYVKKYKPWSYIIKNGINIVINNIVGIKNKI